MTKAKTKPKHGYENIISRKKELPFSEDKLKEIWNKLQPSNPSYKLSDLREDMRRAIGVYTSITELTQNHPKRREQTAALDEIMQKTNELAELMRKTDDITIGLLGVERVRQLENELTNLYLTANVVKKELIDKGSETKPYDFASRTYLRDLIVIYETAKDERAGYTTHRKPRKPSGLFIDFAKIGFSLISVYLDAQSIVSKIKDVRNLIKKGCMTETPKTPQPKV